MFIHIVRSWYIFMYKIYVSHLMLLRNNPFFSRLLRVCDVVCTDDITLMVFVVVACTVLFSVDLISWSPTQDKMYIFFLQETRLDRGLINILMATT
jgi:hypothetical protein